MDTSTKRPTILLDAHMDEVGVIVVENLDGFVKVAALGGPDTRTLPCSEVRFLTSPLPLPGGEGIYGVVSFLAPHLSAGAADGIVPIEDLFIDTGGIEVPVGTAGTLISPFVGAIHESPVTSKALDNRASCAVLLDVLKRLDGEPLNADLALMFSTQEEMGLRGAKPGAAAVNADYAIIVDVTFGRSADDKTRESFELGKGVTIGVGPNMNRRVTERVRAVAEAHGIAYQVEVLPGSSGTNAQVIQLANSGCATALISIPLRYMHTPAEALDLRDLQAAADLLYWVIKEWEED